MEKSRMFCNKSIDQIWKRAVCSATYGKEPYDLQQEHFCNNFTDLDVAAYIHTSDMEKSRMFCNIWKRAICSATRALLQQLYRP